jgi:hypothetical protein
MISIIKIFLLFSPLFYASLVIFNEVTLINVTQYANINFEDASAAQIVREEVAYVFLRRECTESVIIQKLSVNGHFLGEIQVERPGLSRRKEYPIIRRRDQTFLEGLSGLESHRRLTQRGFWN